MERANFINPHRPITRISVASVTYAPLGHSSDSVVQAPSSFDHEGPHKRLRKLPFCLRWLGQVASALQWWLTEILASALSIISFALIIAIARHYRGHAIDDVRLPPGLTINGLITLLSTIASLTVNTGGISSEAGSLDLASGG